jgi:2'-5' RNA ligase
VDRLFVAVWPDPATRERLSAVPRPHHRGVRWIPPEHWHVTLRFLGDIDAEAVSERLGGTRLPRATAVLGPALTVLGPNVVVPVAGLDELAVAVATATDGLGDPPRRRFRGHLTVARCRRRPPSDVVGHRLETSFPVEQVALVRSELRQEGAQYTTIARFATVP